MSDKIEAFDKYRSEMNNVILSKKNKVLNRIFNLDTNAFEEGALDLKTKEIIGLSTSVVLRCDDCVRYHLERCHELGFTTEQLYEALSIASLIGGTIVIPHLRRAAEFWEELSSEK